MSKDSQDSLDQLLGDWAASRQASGDHARRLSAQILTAARDKLDSCTTTSRFVERPVPASVIGAQSTADWGGKLMIGGGGLLLFLVLGGSLLWYNLTTDRSNNGRQGHSIAVPAGSRPLPIANAVNYPPDAAVGADVLAARHKLLTETNALFDNQLSWIAEGAREVSLEVSDHVASGDSEFLLVRVVVGQRSAADSVWSTVWQTDVIARNDALIEIAPEQLGGSSLALWAHVISEGEVAVEMDLSFANGSQSPPAAITVLRSGQPTRVSCTSENGVEWCVFQTAMPLHSS